MEYIKDLAVLGACKSRGLVYTYAPATFRLVARSTITRCGGMISGRLASQFGADEVCLEHFSIVYMQLMVVLQKCELIYP